MESINAAQQILPEKRQRRASFSPMKAIRSLSISSQISHLSTGSDPDVTNATNAGPQRRSTLRKSAPPGLLKKGSLIRKDSKSSTEDSTGHESSSTRPTTPSVVSRSTSTHGHVGQVIKSGPLQPEPSILKPKKEYVVLTPSTLFKFKCRAAAEQEFPSISALDNGLAALPSTRSYSSLKDLSGSADISVPLEKIVSVFKDEGTRPSFGLEIWWKNPTAIHAFRSLELHFSLPCERDDWVKQIRQAVKARAKAVGEDRAPSDIESHFTAILEAKHKHDKDTRIDIYPVVPRRPYTRLAGELKKSWRESSSFYLAFSKYSVFLAQFSQSSNGQKVNPSLVHFGLVTLSRVRLNVNDERFDLIFR